MGRNITMSMNEQMEESEASILHTYNRFPVVFEKGEGCYLYDSEGKEYLDFAAGIAVNALGYHYPGYDEALKSQIDKLMHISNLYYNEPIIDAGARLVQASHMEKAFFTNSGTEAIEGALKAAKKYAYERDGHADHEIIAMNHSFHGRSIGALSVTGNAHYREPFEPLMGGVKFADFNDLESVKAQITDKTCAIITETVQGEGGIYPATKEFLEGLRKLCDEQDIILILDEIQCGMGRTGHYFAWQAYGVQPDINHYEAAKCLTIAGTDIYHPTQDFLTGAEIAFGGDEIRSLKQENYFVLECQAQAFKYWTPYPGQLRLQAYSHLASGAKGLMYWNWHSIHNGYETYWKGLLSHDLDTNPTYEEACVFGREWKNLGKKLIGLKKKNRIALLVDNQCLTAMKWFPIDRDLSYNDVVRWAYDSLYEMNLECDVVDVQAVDMSRYDMIVTPALYSAKESLLQQLEEFVARGGVLVSTFKSFVCNEYLSVYCDKQPHRLHRCFGMSYNQFTEPGTAALKGQKVQYFAELLKTEGAESLGNYEHKYWGKYAGITCNDYGKGRAYYIGCFTEKGILKEIYAQAGRDAGMELPLSVWPVVFRSGENAEGHMLHYVLNYSENQQEVLNPYKRVRDLLSDKVYEPGEKILLMDWNLAILEEI